MGLDKPQAFLFLCKEISELQTASYKDLPGIRDC